MGGELGNQGNETQIFAFKENIYVLIECHLTENMLFFSIRGILGTDILPKWNDLTF